MHGQRRHRHSELPTHQIPVENIAAVYNQAGEDYVAYADGDPEVGYPVVPGWSKCGILTLDEPPGRWR